MDNIELEKETTLNRLKGYLGSFFVKPPAADSTVVKEATRFLKENLEYPAYFAPTKEDFYPFVQSVILQYEKRIFYHQVTIPSLLQETFDDSPEILDPLISYKNHDLVILWNFENEVPNVRKWDVVTQIFDARSLVGKKTLFLTTRRNVEKPFTLIELSSESKPASKPGFPKSSSMVVL